MRIARLGEFNKEKPAVVLNDTEAVFVDDAQVGRYGYVIRNHSLEAMS